MKKTVFFIIAVIVSCGLFSAGYWVGAKLSTPQGPARDTIYVHKTVYEKAPAPAKLDFKRWQATNYVFCSDTLLTPSTPIIVHDTLYIPTTTAYYERLDGRLRLWISGYNPQLDKWELDEQTKIVKTRKHWGFSVGLGPAVVYSPFTNKVDAGIGIFGGLTYTF